MRNFWYGAILLPKNKKENFYMNKKIVKIALIMLLVIASTGCKNNNSTENKKIHKGQKWNMEKIKEKDFLKTREKEIINKDGNKIVLRGTNAGGWLLQEFWMCPTKDTENVHCQTTLINKLTERFGKEKAEELINIYDDNFWTESDFDNCKELGMNVIRLPFTYMTLLDGNGKLKDDSFERLDWFVDNAGKRGMYVILDMHGAQGSQSGRDTTGDTTQGAAFFYGYNAKNNQTKFVKLWEKIAKHYEGNPIVAGYDLLNEPYCDMEENTGKTCWDIYDRAYKAIRKIDSDHIIIMEAKWDPINLPNPDIYGWENVVYQYHQYNYDNQHTPQSQFEGIELKLDLIDAADYNLPSYIGETAFFDNEESWKMCLNELNKRKTNYTTWTYKVTGQNNNWGIYNSLGEEVDAENDSYEEIKKKWSNQQNVVENTTIKPLLEKYFTGTFEE